MSHLSLFRPPPENQFSREDWADHLRSFRFPRTLIDWASIPRFWALDRGWFGGSRRRTHVVMCGFPRSGTTLCQLMCEACVEDVEVYGEERKAIEKARYGSRRHAFLMTKRPNDIYVMDDLRQFYAGRRSEVRFVLFVRDPRAALTSLHSKRPGEYYVSPERWRAIYEFWEWAQGAPDVLTVRYEDLISRTADVQDQLTEFIGWTVTRPFEKFYEAVPEGFDTAALNGVRKIDPDNAERWRDERFADRLRTLLTDELPELPQRLIELGYETDTRWVADYLPGWGQSERRAA